MFSAIAHGQNRNRDIGMYPGDITNNTFLWIDHDNLLIDMQSSNVIYYKNVLDNSKTYDTYNTGLYASPSLISNDPTFNGISSGDFYGYDPNNPDDLYGIATNWDTDNIIESATPLLPDVTFFAVINCYCNDYSSTITAERVFGWRTSTANQSMWICCNQDYYDYPNIFKDVFKIVWTDNNANWATVLGTHTVIKPDTLDKNDPYVYVMAATSRTVWLNGVKVIDAYATLPIDANTYVSSYYEILGNSAGDIAYGTGWWNNGDIAEMLMYGKKLTDAQIVGVSKWLNNKYKVY